MSLIQSAIYQDQPGRKCKAGEGTYLAASDKSVNVCGPIRGRSSIVPNMMFSSASARTTNEDGVSQWANHANAEKLSTRVNPSCGWRHNLDGRNERRGADRATIMSARGHPSQQTQRQPYLVGT